MKVFLYSSPYRYYKNNLLPLAKRFEELGHDVYMSHSYKKTSLIKDSAEVIDIAGKESQDGLIKNFLLNNFKPDVIILTQAWWFLEDKIVKKCKQSGIPFYLLDHAAPVTKYSEKSGGKSHLYRNNLRGARAHIVWGRESIDIMKGRGCKEPMFALGSPRVEEFLKKHNSKKILSLRKKYGDNIAVFYDTNNKMFDKGVNNKLEEAAFFLKKAGYSVLLKPHARSNIRGSKLENIVIFKDKRLEDELIHASSVMLFTFPSSVMIFGAMAKKPIVCLYGDHWSSDAKKFSKRYSSIFLKPSSINEIIPYINQKTNYREFINKNLVFSKNKSACDRIINFIIDDFCSNIKERRR